MDIVGADFTELFVNVEAQHRVINMKDTQIDINSIKMAIFERIYYGTSFDRLIVKYKFVFGDGRLPGTCPVRDFKLFKRQ